MNQKATRRPTIVSHDSGHHADDVFGVAVLRRLNPYASIVRTRDPEVVKSSDFAVDVGGIWDPSAGRFDHHQKEFAEARYNGVVYASAGLVWSNHGIACVKAIEPRVTDAQALRIWRSIDEELVQHLDRADTGDAQGAPGYFGLSAILSAFNSTRLEDNAQGVGADAARNVARLKDENFRVAMDLVDAILERLVAQYYDELAGEDVVRESPTAFDGRVLVLEEAGLRWAGVVCAEMPKVEFVVYPDSTDNQYQIRTVPLVPESFEARRDLPQSWAGLRGRDLAAVTGVQDAVFCHNKVFIAGAQSKEGTLRMAELALAQ